MKKNDFILIVSLLLVSVVIIIAINIFKQEGSKIIISVDGKEVEILDLNRDATFSIKGENGSFNDIEIKDGSVSMVNASCPDKICVEHRPIHYNHETIVCLPNKVVVEIIGGDENPIDSIAK